MRKELRRQILHIAYTIFLVFVSVFFSPFWFIIITALLLIIGMVLVRSETRIGEWVLHQFERDHVRGVFPGKGLFFISIGPILTAIIFPSYLTPALLVLAFPDGLATIFGVLYGKKKTFWTYRKSYVGVVTFLLSSSVVLAFFTNKWLLGAVLLTFLEGVDYHDIHFLDDNIILPLATGAFLMLF